MISKIFIGFDFSINKPACTLIKENQIHFFIWPLNLTKSELEKYQDSGVILYNRNLESISKSKKVSTSDLVMEHTRRSTKLANKIVKDLSEYIGMDDEVYISSEGLSFASAGNATLDLATYKGVLLSKIFEELNPTKIFTYAPITIKKVAGTSQFKNLADKNPMISAFMCEEISHKFKEKILNGEMIAKTNYIHCVDDIVDSYFCCKTMYQKEKMTGFNIWDEAKN